MANLAVAEFNPSTPNPLDLIEQVFISNGWTFERASEEEITAAIGGEWAEYHLRFYWREEGNILQTACVFDTKVPNAKKGQIYETLALINERIWLGHFESWIEDGVLLFRHASVLEEYQYGASLNLIETLIETALVECERYYPVFQFVIWAGKNPKEAIETAMLETVGEA